MNLNQNIEITLKPEDVENACRQFILTSHPELTTGWIIEAHNSLPSIVLYADGGPWKASAALVDKEAPDFWKLRKDVPLFCMEDGNLVVAMAAKIRVAGWIRSFADSIEVALPKLEKGTDYQVFLTETGTLIASKNGAVGRLIGGFHVDLGGKILPNSIWDLKFRCSSPDNGGMVLVRLSDGRKFWAGIYLMDRAGTSRAGQEIADGSKFTPHGYSNLNWNTAREILGKRGLRLPTREEFAEMTGGAKEGTVTTGKPKITERVPGLTSKHGLEQAFGSLWVWGAEIHPVGEDYRYVMGGSWGWAGSASPRYLDCFHAGNSGLDVGVRACGDHLEPE